FQAPVNGAPGLDPGTEFTDKDWIAVDNYPGPGQGNVYLVWRNYSSNPDRNAILLTRSTDEGLTWSPSGGTRIDPASSNGNTSFQLPYVTLGPDHTVYVFSWDFEKGPTIRMRKSTDQGATFGPDRIVTGLKTHLFVGDLGLTDSNGNVFRSPCTFQAVVNPTIGDIYVAYHDQANGSADRGDVFFVQSTDGGDHWSRPLRV